MFPNYKHDENSMKQNTAHFNLFINVYKQNMSWKKRQPMDGNVGKWLMEWLATNVFYLYLKTKFELDCTYLTFMCSFLSNNFYADVHERSFFFLLISIQTSTKLNIVQ